MPRAGAVPPEDVPLLRAGPCDVQPVEVRRGGNRLGRCVHELLLRGWRKGQHLALERAHLHLLVTVSSADPESLPQTDPNSSAIP
jgi:hypothetical protein